MNKSFQEAVIYIKTHNKNSIFFKYWKQTMLIIITPFIVISVLIYSYYNSVSTNNSISNISLDYNNIYRSIDHVFKKIMGDYSALCSSSASSNFVSYKSVSDITMPIINSINYTSEIIKNQCYDSSDFINSISIYSLNSGYCLNTSGHNYYINSDNAPEWFSYYKTINQLNFVLCSPSDSSKLYLGYMLGAISNPGGIVVYEINTNYINLLLKQTPDFSYSVRIYDAQNDTILNLPEDNSLENYNISKKYKASLQDSKTVIKRYKNNFYFTGQLDNDKTIIFSAVIKNKLLSGRTVIVFAVIILLVLAAPTFLSWYIATQFYKSITEIVDFIHASDNAENADNNEISLICNFIMSAQNQNEYLENELASKLSDLKKMQSATLQTQISPHFLFNTLNTINVIIMRKIGYNNQASKTIFLLSDLLTAALNTNDFIVTVNEEIEYSKKYIEIEKIKSNNGFDDIWEIDDTLLNCKTPKLILQPIIENAFSHGIKYLRNSTRGLLKIQAYNKENNIVFCIKNNGPKIDDNILAKIKKDLKLNDIPNPKHIGLCNVHRRIVLLFGEEYGCNVESNDEFTTVTITLPMVK